MKYLIIVSTFFSLVSTNRYPIRLPGSNENIGLSTFDLILKYGYPVQSFEVETKDGYILNLIRIPYNKNNGSQNRPVVFIQHGIESSSDDFLITGSDNGLPYLLSDQGYDVWLGNTRGNKYSLKHKTLKTKSQAYWNFSFHEIAIYDIPAFIDKALAVSGQDTLTYIGHSQGTTVSYVLLSERPEYNNKIRLVTSLAPIAFVSHMKCEICTFLAGNKLFLAFAKYFVGNTDITVDSNLVSLFAQVFCNSKVPINVCRAGLFNVFGKDPAELKTELVPLIFSVDPAGASTKQFLHYGQLIESGKFRQFDYQKGNQQMYGSPSPPDYSFPNITAPVALYYGQNDKLAAVIDVEHLNKSLPNVVDFHLIENAQFSHIDFLWATDVRKLVYNRVLETIKKYN